MSAILKNERARPQVVLAASDAAADHVAGHDSTALLVESDRAAAEESIAPPKPAGVEGPELQIQLGGRTSVPPPAPRDVARLEDVLTVAAKAIQSSDAIDQPAASVELPVRVDPRVSVPPPAPREVARLEDLLTLQSADEVAEIAPKTAAAARQVEVVVEETVAAEASAAVEAAPEASAVVEELRPAAAPERPSADRRYVPAYALRAAFWFEQASAFESGTGDEEDDEPTPAAAVPVAKPVQVAAEITSTNVEPDPSLADVQVETPRKSWVVSLCLLALVGLVVVLTGRRPCRCGCKGS